MRAERSPPIECAERLTLSALTGIPIVQPGDDVPALICAALERPGISPGADAMWSW